MTKRYIKWFALVAILGIVAAACGGDGAGDPTTTPPETETTEPTDEPTPTGTETSIPPTTPTETEPPIAQGGTLKLALTSDVSAAFDPQKEYYSVTWEFYRCCLVRTLMSYNGKPTDQQGAEVFPDIAEEAPQVSPDGLTWTFKLKPNIAYSPPIDGNVVAGDIIRALERTACSECAAGGYSFYYSAIKGFTAFGDGEADTISGLRAPDDTTLEVELTQPAGDLPFRFAMAATAPIAPNGDAPLGVAEGHNTDYGRFLVGTGPYMFEGMENVDFSLPAKDQKPAAGYVPGKSINFVRNPNYDPATDDLRLANVDAIEMTITTASAEDLANQVSNGSLDMVFDGVPPTDQIQEFLQDPERQDQVQIHPSDAVRYISFNIAEPPLDDIHVRKALNLAADKDGIRELRGGAIFGEIAGHIIVDSLTGNVLQGFDPYGSENSQGDIEAAKAEMAQSKYDEDGDGVCDDPVCENVLTISDQGDPYPATVQLLVGNWEPLGITLDVKSFERTTMYAKCNDPSTHYGICPAPGWGKDYADAFTFGPPLFGGDGYSGGAAIGPDACCNYSLVGASAETLSEFNYDVTEVPSVDAQLDECTAATGEQRVECWADVDRELMENVVPWIPYLFDNNVDVFSDRITNYSFDQFAGLMALDQIAIDEAAA